MNWEQVQILTSVHRCNMDNIIRSRLCITDNLQKAIS